MRRKGRTVGEAIAQIATRSHGVTTRAELLEAGISPAQIEHRLRDGSLLRVHRGVYRAGHLAPGREATYLAAVRAAGPGALLSGRAAAHLLGVLGGREPRPEVTAPTERRIPGVDTRRARRGEVRDGTTWHGIPVTTVARTLVDVAAVLDPGALSRACHEAEVRHRATPADVEAVLARRPTSRGAARLRAILHGEEQLTLSALERRFLVVLRDAGLPIPLTNRFAGGRRVDCRWPAQRLTVELDGYRFHASRHAWEQDRRREREARARGDEFRRYTYGDVVEDPRHMLAELRAFLL